MSDFDIQDTYLYKLHLATASLDGFFDSILHQHAGLGLPQLLLLQAIKQLQPVKQAKLGKFLSLTPPTLSRQVEVVRKKGWVTTDRYAEDGADRRVQVIGLTSEGTVILNKGMDSLEKHAFHIFKGQDTPLSLMKHIDQLITNMKGK